MSRASDVPLFSPCSNGSTGRCLTCKKMNSISADDLIITGTRGVPASCQRDCRVCGSLTVRPLCACVRACVCTHTSVWVKWSQGETVLGQGDFKHSKGKINHLPFPFLSLSTYILNICLPRVYLKSNEVIFKNSSNLGIKIFFCLLTF